MLKSEDQLRLGALKASVGSSSCVIATTRLRLGRVIPVLPDGRRLRWRDGEQEAASTQPEAELCHVTGCGQVTCLQLSEVQVTNAFRTLLIWIKRPGAPPPRCDLGEGLKVLLRDTFKCFKSDQLLI